MKLVGMKAEPKSSAKTAEVKAIKAGKATPTTLAPTTASGVSPIAQTAKPNLAKQASTMKKITRTQHKGV